MTKAELQKMYPIGCGVHVKAAPHGRPGQVTGQARNRVLVCFPSLGGYCASFKPESLVRV
jgi:hypothetical protein